MDGAASIIFILALIAAIAEIVIEKSSMHVW